MSDIKEWRPKDWNPDYTITILENISSDDLANYTSVLVKSAYEAGADAILKELKKLGFHMPTMIEKPKEVK